MKPIINSRLDTDTYKFRMHYAFWRFCQIFLQTQEPQTTYSFTNRTNTFDLTEYIELEELREQLQYLSTLTFSEADIRFIKSSGILPLYASPGYFDFLQRTRIPEILVEKADGTFRIECSGSILDATFCETPILGIVTHLFNLGIQKEQNLSEWDVIERGLERLNDKINLLRLYPHNKLTGFGCRRRYSRAWEWNVTDCLVNKIPRQFTATSNVWMAREFGLRPQGTCAHEYFQFFAALRDNTSLLRSSPMTAAFFWSRIFGRDARIALTDTFGSASWFKDFPAEEARQWKGYRPDSMHPIRYWETLLEPFLKRCGIDPQTQLLVLSDSLQVKKDIIPQGEYFRGKIPVVFGWGGDMTNDMGLPTLSTVVKLSLVDGRPTVKLSDNPAKTMGPPELVERYKKVFDCDGGVYEKCLR